MAKQGGSTDGAGGECVLDHVAFGVPEVDAVAPFLVGELGGRPYEGGPGLGFLWWQWSFAGGGRVEVIAPHGPPGGFVHRFLERHGPGVHHVTFKVPELCASAGPTRPSRSPSRSIRARPKVRSGSSSSARDRSRSRRARTRSSASSYARADPRRARRIPPRQPRRRRGLALHELPTLVRLADACELREDRNVSDREPLAHQPLALAEETRDRAHVTLEVAQQHVARLAPPAP